MLAVFLLQSRELVDAHAIVSTSHSQAIYAVFLIMPPARPQDSAQTLTQTLLAPPPDSSEPSMQPRPRPLAPQSAQSRQEEGHQPQNSGQSTLKPTHVSAAMQDCAVQLAALECQLVHSFSKTMWMLSNIITQESQQQQQQQRQAPPRTSAVQQALELLSMSYLLTSEQTTALKAKLAAAAVMSEQATVARMLSASDQHKGSQVFEEGHRIMVQALLQLVSRSASQHQKDADLKAKQLLREPEASSCYVTMQSSDMSLSPELETTAGASWETDAMNADDFDDAIKQPAEASGAASLTQQSGQAGTRHTDLGQTGHDHAAAAAAAAKTSQDASKAVLGSDATPNVSDVSRLAASSRSRPAEQSSPNADATLSPGSEPPTRGKRPAAEEEQSQPATTQEPCMEAGLMAEPFAWDKRSVLEEKDSKETVAEAKGSTDQAQLPKAEPSSAAVPDVVGVMRPVADATAAADATATVASHQVHHDLDHAIKILQSMLASSPEDSATAKPQAGTTAGTAAKAAPELHLAAKARSSPDAPSTGVQIPSEPSAAQSRPKQKRIYRQASAEEEASPEAKRQKPDPSSDPMAKSDPRPSQTQQSRPQIRDTIAAVPRKVREPIKPPELPLDLPWNTLPSIYRSIRRLRLTGNSKHGQLQSEDMDLLKALPPLVQLRVLSKYASEVLPHGNVVKFLSLTVAAMGSRSKDPKWLMVRHETKTAFKLCDAAESLYKRLVENGDLPEGVVPPAMPQLVPVELQAAYVLCLGGYSQGSLSRKEFAKVLLAAIMAQICLMVEEHHGSAADCKAAYLNLKLCGGSPARVRERIQQPKAKTTQQAQPVVKKPEPQQLELRHVTKAVLRGLVRLKVMNENALDEKCRSFLQQQPPLWQLRILSCFAGNLKQPSDNPSAYLTSICKGNRTASQQLKLSWLKPKSMLPNQPPATDDFAHQSVPQSQASWY